MNIKKRHYSIPIILLVAIMVIFLGTQPVNSLTMDVNPSIEIVTSRLDRVVEINSLNKDAEELLKNYNPKNKNLENTVNDLIDLMILTGHIKGGEDNFIMITVDDDSVHSKYVNRVNKTIAALLENKQIEATVLNQGKTKAKKENKMTGLELVAQTLQELDVNLTTEKIKHMTVREIIEYLQVNNIKIEKIFKIVDDDEENKNVPGQITEKRISLEEAKKIALAKVGGGTITEFEFDEDEYEIEIKYDDKEYEIEIDAFTGNITDSEVDDD